MIYCNKCGIELDVNAKFCPICGTQFDFSAGERRRSIRPLMIALIVLVVGVIVVAVGIALLQLAS
jgi:hypothetical protein